MKGQLGNVQRSVLASLVNFGGWHRNCGWTWSTPTGTTRIMDSLVARGLATLDKDGNYEPSAAGTLLVAAGGTK